MYFKVDSVLSIMHILQIRCQFYIEVILALLSMEKCRLSIIKCTHKDLHYLIIMQFIIEMDNFSKAANSSS